MKLGTCLLFLSTLAMAQTGESAFFRAILLPANEVPAINNPARGVADVIASVVRDPAGQIVSGNIDVLLRTTLAAANTATGLNLHNGIAGQNVPVALSTALSSDNARPLQTGADSLRLWIAVKNDNPAALAMLRAVFQDPTNFYVNLTSADQPSGLMRGQLVKAQVAVLMAILTSDAVMPAARNSGTGFGQVVAIGTRDAAGNWTSGEVYVWARHGARDLLLPGSGRAQELQLHAGLRRQPGACGRRVADLHYGFGTDDTGPPHGSALARRYAGADRSGDCHDK